MCFANTFFHFVACLFVFFQRWFLSFKGIFQRAEVYNLFVNLPIPMSQGFLPKFSSRSYAILHFMFRTMIQFEFYICYEVRVEGFLNFFFAFGWMSRFSRTICLNVKCLFSLELPWHPVKNELIIYVWGFFLLKCQSSVGLRE